MTKQTNVDNQHRHILEIVEAIQYTVAHDAGSGSVDLLLEHLLRYLNAHFATEEELMAAYGSADLEEHRAQHADCRARVTELLTRARADGFQLSPALEFLRAWFRNHEEIYDQRYKLVPLTVG